MGKIANEIFITDMLREGKRLPKVTSEGCEKGVLYYVKDDALLKMSYFLEEFDEIDYFNIIEQLKSNFNNFKKYLPKFGKYEIEEFIKQKFLHSLLITGNFTDLFNTEIYFNDISYIRISSEDLLKKLLPCFIVTKTTGATFYLKFKWEKQEA